MALTFPSSDLVTYLHAHADLFGVETCEFDILRKHDFTGLESGEMIVKERVPPRWKATIATTPVEYKYWKKIRARLWSLDGSLRMFYLFDTLSMAPEEDPDGTILGASTPTILAFGGNNRSLSFTGLPAAYQLREGDAFHFAWDGGTRRAYHVLMEDALASGAGVTPVFEVQPFIREGAEEGAAITLIRPSAMMRLTPQTARYNNAGPLTGRVSFDAIQVL